jgi:transcriptional regulator with XRE-family HTH domain
MSDEGSQFDFAGRLLAYRAIQQLSQYELSIKSGLDHSTLSRIEHRNRRPARNSVDLICQALDLPRDEWDMMLDLAGYAAVRIDSLMNVPKLGQLDDIYPRLEDDDQQDFDEWLDDGLETFRERLAA